MLESKNKQHQSETSSEATRIDDKRKIEKDRSLIAGVTQTEKEKENQEVPKPAVETTPFQFSDPVMLLLLMKRFTLNAFL